VQRQAVALYLHVQGQVVFEAMLPIDRKSQVVDIELTGLGLVEDAKNGNRLQKRSVHHAPPADGKADLSRLVKPKRKFLPLGRSGH
jgi:hypothetical protein